MPTYHPLAAKDFVQINIPRGNNCFCFCFQMETIVSTIKEGPSAGAGKPFQSIESVVITYSMFFPIISLVDEKGNLC